MTQTIITAENGYAGLDAWIEQTSAKTVLLVCDESIRFLKDISAHFEAIGSRGIQLVRFSDFQPNPLYESVIAGIQVFLQNNCSAIIAVGGGSAMDVAKCIKLFSNMDHGRNYLEQAIVPNSIPFLAIPTTAGTGSEATRYAAIYYNDAKQSVTSESIIPEAVLLDPGVLKTLPAYQKKSTMMDAFCHALESFWSVNSTEESRRFSKQAIELVLQNMDGYLANTEDGNAGMLLAANTAGKAINITQTTAGHAMCYKITSLFHCAHGHAAALCDRVLFPWMLDNSHLCIDSRGEDFLKDIFQQIAGAMGCDTPKEAVDRLNAIFDKLGFENPFATEEQFAILKLSVNPVRLKNHPIKLDTETIDSLYRHILRQS
jgi:alcohol dehydrogenase class IV